MKRTIFLSALLVTLISIAASGLYAESEAPLKGFTVTRFPYYVYSDASSRLQTLLPSGWMGDIRDLKIDHKATENPQSGKTSIKITYTAKIKDGANWTGLYFQVNPDSRWNTRRGGNDLNRAKRIYFYARGNNGKEVVEFKVAGHKEQTYTHVSKTTIKVRLTDKWEKYELDVTNMTLDEMAGGFCFVMNNHDNPKGCTFYLDEIYYTDEIEKTDMTMIEQ
ncbi:MAG: hypothetical protein KKH98_04405 [Spirochaetes bacterium]|nr:hypothetical protein [Spirochaetota bacterium]